MKQRGVWMVLAVALAMQGCGDDDDHTHGGTGGTGGSGGAGGTGGSGGTGGPGGSGGTGGTGGTGGSGDITINFKGVVGDQPFACGTEYASVGTPAQAATPVDFRFYVQDVRLVKSDATEVPLTLATNDWQSQNVAMIDFEDATGACDQGDAPTNTAITGTAPADTYVGVKFTVGIPQSLNHADLSTQASPLNKSGLFWGWNYGHIFLAAVSRSETLVDVDAGGDVDAGAALGHTDHVTHVGATGCNGDPMGGGDPVTACTNPNRAQITFSTFDLATDQVVVDFAEIKRGSDVVAGGPCHSFSDDCIAPFANLGLNFATGGAGATAQTVFRKE